MADSESDDDNSLAQAMGNLDIDLEAKCQVCGEDCPTCTHVESNLRKCVGGKPKRYVFNLNLCKLI
jgi:hypothetical protein